MRGAHLFKLLAFSGSVFSFFIFLAGSEQYSRQIFLRGGGKALARTQAFPMARSLSVTQDLQMDLQ